MRERVLKRSMLLKDEWKVRNMKVGFFASTEAITDANTVYIEEVQAYFEPRNIGMGPWWNIDWATGEVVGHRLVPIPPSEVGL